MAGAGEKPDERADDAEPVAEGVEATNKPAGTPEAVKPAAPEKTKAPKQIAALKGEVQQGQEAAQAEAKVDEEVGNLEDRADEDADKDAEDAAEDAEDEGTDTDKDSDDEKGPEDKATAEAKAKAKADAEKAKGDPTTWTALMEYWTRSVADNGGKITWTAALMTAWYAFTTVEWSPKEDKEEDETEDDSIDGPDGLHYRFEDKTVPPKDPKIEKLLEQAKKQLDGVKEDHEDWITMTEAASEKYELGPKGPSIILGMSRFESGFNPDVKAKGSSATGLGQFIKKTWGTFQADLPEGDDLKGRPATDPEAALNAIAWYSSKNMKACGLKPEQPDFAARLYETHHEGAAGAKKLWAFREVPPGPEGRIPASYKDKEFPKFGVEKVETYKDYSDLILAMSGRVQSVAELYQKELGTEPESEDESESNP